MDEVGVARALASRTRIEILGWLREPGASFESRVDGDLSEGGVCVSLIATKAGISQPSASRHISVLKSAGLVETKRVAQRNYHRRDEAGIQRAKQLLMDGF